VMALAFGLAAFAVIAAIGAFEAIWRDGRKGLGAAIRGLLIGLLVLAVPILAAWHIIAYPRLTDVSTDPENPPALTAAASAPADDLRPITDPSVEEIDMQREAYPDIVPRHYPVGPGRV